VNLNPNWPDQNKWLAYWDLEPDGPPTMLEQGPGWRSPEEAVEWARARTPRVFLHPGEGEPYLWAGVGRPPAGDSGQELEVFIPAVKDSHKWKGKGKH
jgi:hypothetical protein